MSWPSFSSCCNYTTQQPWICEPIWCRVLAPDQGRLFLFFFFLRAFYFILGYNQLTIIVIVSGRQQRDSAIHIQVSTVSRTPFPSRLSHNTEQGSMGGCFWNTLQKFWDRHRLLLCLQHAYWEWPLSLATALLTSEMCGNEVSWTRAASKPESLSLCSINLDGGKKKKSRCYFH